MRSVEVMGNEITAPVLLLVEGQDEAYLVRRMCQHWFAERAVQIDIEDAQGGDRLTKQFKAIWVRPKGPLKVVGVITDSEENPADTAQRWRELFKLTDSSIDRPCHVLQLPSPDSSGALETLLLEALANDSIAICATHFRDCVKPQLAHRTVAQMDKIAIRAWLSATFGEAYANVFKAYERDAARDSLNFDHVAFALIKEFIEGLLIEAETAALSTAP